MRRIAINYARPEQVGGEYQRVLGEATDFGASRTAVEFSSAALTRPSPMYNAEVHRVLAECALTMQRQMREGLTLAERLAVEIEAALPRVLASRKSPRSCA